MLTHRKNKQLGPIQVPDAAPLAQGVEDAANRLSAAVETASARTAKSAKKNAKQAGDRASALGEQIGERVSHAQSDLQRARRRRRLWLFIRRRNRIDDAILKAQLAKTSHELSRESTDLTHAVKSLNSVIKSNRKAAARGRTRLISGAALGALVMYHVDPEHGKERRNATARRLKGVVGGSAS
jgi:hypothetical protein